MDGKGVYGAQEAQRRVPIRRPRKACLTCRSLKTRCLPDSEKADPKAQCSRCARLNLPCVYSRTRRGKKTSDDTSSLPAASGSQRSSGHRALKWDALGLPAGSYQPERIEGGMMVGQVPNDVLVPWYSDPRMPPHQYHLAGPSSDPYTGSSASLETVSPPMFANGRKTTGTFVEFLEPPLGSIQDSASASPRRPPARRNSTAADAVDLNLVSEPEARHLFHQFMTRVMPSSMLFDQHYHTYERVRPSGPLFSAILYATARFFRPELAEAIHAVTESAISRRMIRAEYDLELVQAILVLVYWKHPRDRTFYQKLGAAARLVDELRLAWPADTRVPQGMSEEEERRRVNVERTVHGENEELFVLTTAAHGLDKAYSFMLQLPPCQPGWMPPPAAVMAWAEAHRHLDVPGDFLKAHLAGLWEFYCEFGGHPNIIMEETPLKLTRGQYDDAERRIGEHLAAWRGNHLHGQLGGYADLITKVTLFKVHVLGMLQGIVQKTPSGFLPQAEEIGGIIKQVAAAGDLIFWSDLTSAILSVPGILLHNLRNRFSTEDKRRAAAFCRDMFESLHTVPSPMGEHSYALRYIERFYRRLGAAFERLCQGAGEDPQAAVALNTLLQYQWPVFGDTQAAPEPQVGPSPALAHAHAMHPHGGHGHAPHHAPPYPAPHHAHGHPEHGEWGWVWGGMPPTWEQQGP